MSAANGSNPRLDRIEKLLEQTARENRETARESREAARENARGIKDAARVREEAELANRKAHARFERDLKRWATLGVKEARSHRKRMLEIDRKIDQLSSAQLLTEQAHRATEETLQRFIASMTSGNGKAKA